ncbi:hypothetical protein DCO58_01315 [Helicobacter saguini]|uniref:Autotransporter domain-containing protein n=2 Tax=Helicobacter saguini TaxID=1548018 RepID=A0A6L7DEI3_9HELI|nr:S-layer family protein [Helicobacter saguini]MWV66354.1 hypothetical protein [Helicobacter saguini]MWV68706.1 hypothetical protein [Helicobacter saguini]MWV71743.1 hypothetical protein [Helicobacter saguini]
MVNPHITTRLNAKDKNKTNGQTKENAAFLNKKTLANISFIASLMIAGGNTLLAADITTEQVDGTTLSDLTNNVSGANGKLNNVTLTSPTTILNVKSDSGGVVTGKNVTIGSNVTTAVIDNNSKNFAGGITSQNENQTTTIIIKNTTTDTSDAAKISGNIVGAAGTLIIQNDANSTIEGDIQGKNSKLEIDNAATISGNISGEGDIEINNTKTLGAADKTITGGAGKLTINNNDAAAEIKSAITGGTGAVEITNAGTISDNISGADLTINNTKTIGDTGKTITASGTLNITNGSESVTDSEIKSAITAGAQNATITNYGKISDSITAGGGDLTITNTKEIGATGKTIQGGAGKLTINNNDAAAEIKSAITGGTGAVEITNAGTISDNISGADLTINNTKTIGDTGKTITASGTLNITNGSESVTDSEIKSAITAGAQNATITNYGKISDSITAGGGDLTITNTKEIGATGKTIQGGAGKLTINNNDAAAEIKSAITGGTGAVEITNAGTISDNISGADLTINNTKTIGDTGKTITASGTLNITNGSESVTDSEIKSAITAGAQNATITNYGKISDSITAGGGDLTITNTKEIGATGKTIQGGAGKLTINNNDAAAEIKSAITGGTGAVEITNAGTISDNISGADLTINNTKTIGDTGKTITASGTLNITNGSESVTDSEIKSAITAGAQNATITNYGKISDSITAGGGDLTITNTKEIGATGKTIQGGAGKLTINNNDAAAEIKSAITGGTGAVEITNAGTISDNISGADLTINNTKTIGDTGKTITASGTLNITNGSESVTDSEIKSAITAGAQNATITNAGTLSGAITGGAGALSITNNATGKITEDITAAAGDLTISNAGDMSTAGKKVTGATGNVTIENSGNLAYAIEASTGADKTTKITNLAAGTISGDITKAVSDLIVENYGTLSGKIDASQVVAGKSATITNDGTLSGAITGGAGALSITNNGGTISDTANITAGDGILTLNNTGNIESVITVTKNTNTITNSGVINELKIGTGATDTILDITNSGVITSLNFEAAGTAKLQENYAVTLGSLSDYNTNGALGIKTGTATNATIQIADNNSFLINMGDDVSIGEAYRLANFISGSNGGATLQNHNGTAITTLESKHFTTSQNIYDLNLYQAGGENVMSITVAANKSIGSIASIEVSSSMNAQVVRTHSVLDSVFDSIATGEMGNVPYPRENYYSAVYTRGVKLAAAVQPQAQQLQELEKLNTTTDVNTNSIDAIAMQEVRNQNKRTSWLGFITPYYSTSSISPSGFSATTSSSYGFVGGAAGSFSNGALLGFHIGVEGQTTGRQGAEMRTKGVSTMIGIYTKIPFTQISMKSLALVPFTKISLNGMVAFNNYSLTPIADITRDADGVVGGFSGSATIGLDMPTNFGYFTPEIGIMQQFVAMPELSYLNFNTSSNNQIIKATNITPLYVLGQLRYTKEISVGNIGIYPTIKGGVRYAVYGSEFNNTITLTSVATNNIYSATNTIDALVGVAEVGLGVKIAGNATIGLGYLGEFSASIQTHNIHLKAGMQF